MAPQATLRRTIGLATLWFVLATGVGGASPRPSGVATDIGANATGVPITKRVDALADAYVKVKKPAFNFGHRHRLKARSRSRIVTFVKFRVPKRFGAVTQATLRLRVTRGVSSRIAVRKSAKKWDEASITYSNAPNIGRLLGKADLTGGGAHWVDIDVSSLVDGPGLYSFAVKGLEDDLAIFRSRETPKGPRLKLRLANKPSDQPIPPIRAAFMYPWFPNAWDQGSPDPYTHYTPSLGLYDSADKDTIDTQVSLATAAGLEAFIASWWGPGHHTDDATRAFLNRVPNSPNPGFRLAVYYEEEGQSDPSPASIADDLDYLQSLFDKPAYLRVDGAPVVFVWADGNDGAGMASRWAQAVDVFDKPVHIVLKVFPGYAGVPDQPDSWHQYGPASAYAEHLPHSAVVSPGFWHAEEATPRLQRSTSRFRSDVRDMVASGAFWQLITTWNEWGEGTAVEPADEFGTAYLDILRDEILGTPPSTTTTVAGTTTTQPTDDAFVIAAVGDIGASSGSAATLAAIASGDAEIMLALGDLAYGDADADEWCSFVKSYLGNSFPVELLVGNHEDDDRLDGFIGDFVACLPDRMSSTGAYGAEYYFDIDGVARVIAIGADNDVDGVDFDYSVGTPHYRWLRDRIREAKGAATPWVIVAMHKVCLSAGEKSCEVGTDLLDMLIDEGVDVVLSGHDHNYQRSKQLGCAEPDNYVAACVVDSGADGRYPKGQGTVFLVIGTGGGLGLYGIDTGDGDYRYLASAMGGGDAGSGRGYLELSLGASTLVGHFVGSTASFEDIFRIE